jgi:UDP-N-acetylglucosamine 2-epimerase (non-hydrolysing)
MPLKVMLVAGARPNFMKIAPVHRALARRPEAEVSLIHTGQHYDSAMSQLFFEQLGIPAPDMNLEVGSASHALQTAQILERFERVVLERKPDLVVVVGDVNSTAACGLVAKKIRGVGLAHVEAGLRSFDRTMPEEINRLVTDALSDLLFTSERSGERNLLAEGVPERCIHFAGNVMIDTLRAHLDRARETGALAAQGVRPGEYALLTLHRPSNVDDPAVFDPLFAAIAGIARRLPVVFPVHPRTRPALERWIRERGEAALEQLRPVPPLGYLEFLHLMSEARLLMTDSGGIQEESTVLGIPCLTLRENTERPATVEEGTNLLVGTDPGRLTSEAGRILAGEGKQGRVPEGWDGHAAERIADFVAGWDGSMR